jgi:hypothetical protein
MNLERNIETTLQTEPTKVAAYLGRISAIGVTARERLGVLKNPGLMTRIRAQLGLEGALSVAMALMEGNFEWRGPGLNGFYSKLLANPDTGINTFLRAIPTQQSLNCWEAVLIGLYVIGQIDGNAIYDNIYRVLETSTLPDPQTWHALGFSTVDEYHRNNDSPAVGMLMYYVPTKAGRLTQSFPNHVAVSIGDGEAISLWTQPGGINYVQRIPVQSTFPGSRIFVGKPSQVLSTRPPAPPRPALLAQIRARVPMIT